MGKSEGTNGRLVMIVDDDESIRDLMDFIVKREGFDTVLDSSAKSAVEKAEKLNPAVILLDMSLTNSTGMDVVEKLKDRNIPIVIMTGYTGDHEDLKNIRKYPCVKCLLTKPVSPQSVADIIKEIAG